MSVYRQAWFIAVGNLLFRYRNLLFPVLMLAVLLPPAGNGRWRYAGLALAAAGQALRGATIGFAYIVRGGRNRRVYADGLVMAGLFGTCRNPLYAGNLLIYTGLCTFHGNPWTIPLGVAAFAFCYCAIVAAEEHYLRGRYGADYERYCRGVPRWLPDPRLLPEAVGGLAFDWRRVLAKDYSTIAAWVCAVWLIEGWRRWRWLDGGWPVAREALLPPGMGLVLTVLLMALARVAKKRGWLARPAC